MRTVVTWTAIVLVLLVGLFVSSTASFVVTYEDGRVRGDEWWAVLLPLLITGVLVWGIHYVGIRWKRRLQDDPGGGGDE